MYQGQPWHRYCKTLDNRVSRLIGPNGAYPDVAPIKRNLLYMANMPDKFGIKFWLLADAQPKYLCNDKPYLGRDPSRSRCSDLLGDVCLTLLQPYYKKGYNVTTDNHFTSLKLSEELKQKKTTILGTIWKQRREVPSTELIMKDKEL